MEYNIDELLERAIESHGSHFDIAQIIYVLYKNKYRVINDKWEMFNKNNEWVFMENANDLYINISKGLFDYLKTKSNEMLEKGKSASTIEEGDRLKDKSKIITKIAFNCKMVNYKQSLIKECKPVFSVLNERE